MAQRAWQENQVDRMLEILAKQRPQKASDLLRRKPRPTVIPA
jgi:hypothetical protein